mgnify:FL=1
MKHKKRIFIPLLLVLLSVLIAAFTGAWNLDHLAAGKLKSVEVTYSQCMTCPDQTKTIEITDKASMKALENLIFYRFTSPFAPVTNEAGALDVDFVYEFKTLHFNLVGTVQGGYPPAIKSKDRSRRYEMSQADMTKLLDLVDAVFK